MALSRRNFTLASLAAIAAPAASPALAADKVTIGVVGAGSTVLWPHYIAVDKGFYTKRNIEPDLVVAPSSPGLQQQIAAGALNVGVGSGSPDPIRAVSKGAPNVILRIDTVPSPYLLMAKTDVKSIADLKGRTISLDSPKGITRAYFDRFMKPTGLKEGDYDLIFQGSTPSRFAALKSGSADAAMLTAPFDSEAEAAGFKRLVVVSDVVKDIPFGVTAGSRPWVLANPDLTKRWMQAYVDAVLWFYDKNNHAEAIQVALHNTKQKQADLEKAYDFFQRIQFFNRENTVSRSQINNVMDVLIGFGDLDKRIDVAKLVAPQVTKIVD